MLTKAGGYPPHLPDFAGIYPDHRLPGLAPEGLLKLRHVATTPLMRYFPGECGSVMALARKFSGRSFSHAHWAKPTKKRCSGVSPSSGLQLHALSGFAPRHVGQHGSAEVGDVLSARQLAVDLDVVHHRVPGVLVAHAVHFLLEALGVVVSPPIPQVSLGVELAPLVVEAVGQLVADGGTGVSVVRGLVQLGIEERRLEDSGGELMSFICGL